MSLPKVSCLCPTYGRPECLEEAIHSFLIQDYLGEKELVIVNDLPSQKLIFDHPQVRIVNLPEEVGCLGRKFNLTAKAATGEVLCVWDDDDIFLPHRLSYSIERLKNGLFHTWNAFYLSAENLVEPAYNLFHSCLAIHRDTFWGVGGYEEVDRMNVDRKLIYDLYKEYGHFSTEIPQSDYFYIYRWDVTGNYHVSKWDNDSVSHSVKEYVSQKNQEGQLRTGEIVLQPHWAQDYCHLKKAGEGA